MRLILSQGGACACVIYRVTMVTEHDPSHCKISLVNIANGGQASNFPVIGIPLIFNLFISTDMVPLVKFWRWTLMITINVCVSIC